MYIILRKRYTFKIHLVLTGIIWLGFMCPSTAVTLDETVVAEHPAIKAIVDWLECIECNESQLEHLLVHADDVKPLLVAAHRDGPTPAIREEYRRFLSANYQQLKYYAKEHGKESVLQSEEAYIDMYLQNFETRYKRRAGFALEMLSKQVGSDETYF